jgi:hypothetical protein
MLAAVPIAVTQLLAVATPQASRAEWVLTGTVLMLVLIVASVLVFRDASSGSAARDEVTGEPHYDQQPAEAGDPEYLPGYPGGSGAAAPAVRGADPGQGYDDPAYRTDPALGRPRYPDDPRSQAQPAAERSWFDARFRTTPPPEPAPSAPDPRYPSAPPEPRYPGAPVDPRYAAPADPRYAGTADPRYAGTADPRYPAEAADPRYRPADPIYQPSAPADPSHRPADPRYRPSAPADPRYQAPGPADPRSRPDPRYQPDPGYGLDPRQQPASQLPGDPRRARHQPDQRGAADQRQPAVQGQPDQRRSSGPGQPESPRNRGRHRPDR